MYRSISAHSSSSRLERFGSAVHTGCHGGQRRFNMFVLFCCRERREPNGPNEPVLRRSEQPHPDCAARHPDDLLHVRLRPGWDLHHINHTASWCLWSLWAVRTGPPPAGLQRFCHSPTLHVPPGYVQGMSDLLSPILYVMENEVDAFWCFVSFMDQMVRNQVRTRTIHVKSLVSAQEPIGSGGQKNFTSCCFNGYIRTHQNFQTQFRSELLLSISVYSGVLEPNQ